VELERGSMGSVDPEIAWEDSHCWGMTKDKRDVVGLRRGILKIKIWIDILMEQYIHDD